MEEDNYETLRRQNLEMMKRKFEEQFGKIQEVPDVNELDDVDDFEDFKVTEKRKPRKYSYKKIRMSLPPRMSLRSRGECSIDYSEADKLLDELENPGRMYVDKKILVRRSMPVVCFRKVPVQNLKPVSEITADDIARICYKTTQREYDPANGTTCHQCRQKTSDFKSICRNPSCNGIRGQFCGFCLLKRYGEDVAKVVVDEQWSCPPCRNICNCSICRKRLGKRPTGILAPIAESRGYSNVKDFLLEEEKDLYIYEDNSDKENTPEDFIDIKTNETKTQNPTTPEKTNLSESSNFTGFSTQSSDNKLFQKMKILLEKRKKISEHVVHSSSEFPGFPTSGEEKFKITSEFLGFPASGDEKLENDVSSTISNTSFFRGFSPFDTNSDREKLLEAFLKTKLFSDDTKEPDEQSQSFDFVGFSTSDITESEIKIKFFESQLEKLIYHPND